MTMFPSSPLDVERRLAALERRLDMVERMLLDRPLQAPALTPASALLAPSGPAPAVDSRLPLPGNFQVTPPDSAWVPILHTVQRSDPSSPRPCGQVGLYLTRRIREGERCDIRLLRVLVAGECEWREPTFQDVPRCSSCGMQIDPFSSTDLDYLSGMLPAGTGGHPAPVSPGADRDGSPSPPATSAEALASMTAAERAAVYRERAGMHAQQEFSDRERGWSRILPQPGRSQPRPYVRTPEVERDDEAVLARLAALAPSVLGHDTPALLETSTRDDDSL